MATITNNISHAVERKTFEILVNKLVKKLLKTL